MTADGERVVVQGEFKTDEYADAFECRDLALQVVDRDGTTVSKWSIEKTGRFVGLTPSGQGFLFHSTDEVLEYDFGGHVLNSIPVSVLSFVFFVPSWPVVASSQYRATENKDR